MYWRVFFKLFICRISSGQDKSSTTTLSLKKRTVAKAKWKKLTGTEESHRRSPLTLAWNRTEKNSSRCPRGLLHPPSHLCRICSIRLKTFDTNCYLDKQKRVFPFYKVFEEPRPDPSQQQRRQQLAVQRRRRRQRRRGCRNIRKEGRWVHFRRDSSSAAATASQARNTRTTNHQQATKKSVIDKFVYLETIIFF